jgi:GxxExxY protein
MYSMEDQIVYEIIYEVSRGLGRLHREAVYQRAIEVELRMRNIPYECERIVPVRYKDHIISHMRMDLVIDGLAVVELKAVKSLKEGDECQLKRYLENSEYDCGYLVNFSTDGGFELRQVSKNEIGGFKIKNINI